MQNYLRVCRGVKDFGKMLTVKEAESNLKTIVSKYPESDWYLSAFTYSQDAMDHFDKEGQILGFDGTVWAKKLIFDFDDKANVESAKTDAVTLLARLQKEGIDIESSVIAYFSGNKGFHIEVLLSEELTSLEVKDICMNVGGDLGTFDDSIYNKNRIFRIVNTKHQESNLYKIPLTPEELVDFTLDHIKVLAREPRNLNYDPRPSSNPAFIAKYNVPFEPPTPAPQASGSTEVVNGIRGLDTVNFHNCPKTTPRCIYALQHGVMVAGVGDRNAIFLRLATFFRNQGLHKDVNYNLLKGVIRLNHRLYPEHKPYPKDELWNNILPFVYNEKAKNNKVNVGGWGTDPTNDLLKKYCDCIKSDISCALHQAKSSAVKIDDVSSSFSSFAENFDTNRVLTGIEFIDEFMSITVGTTTLLVAACGAGKTTLALNIMENANRLDQHTMFFSLDMHKNLVYLKLAQKLTSYSQKEIMKFYQEKNQAKMAEIKKAISTAYDKTFFDFSGTLTMEEMGNRVKAIEEKHGVKIKLAVVDYASRIDGPHSDSYANARRNALKSTEVANDTDAAWIILSQISRNVGDGMTPLRTKRAAKESGDWEESATNVITMWRPFLGIDSKDDVVRLYLAKNRMGRELERPLKWNGAKGEITDFPEEDLINYESTRAIEEKEVLKNRRNFGIFAKQDE